MSVFVTGAGIPQKFVNYINYIESNGNQYINTNFNPNQDTRIVINLNVLNTSLDTCAIFGARNSFNVNAFGLWKTGSTCRSDYNSVTQTINVSPLGDLLIDKNKNVTSINNVTNTVTYSAFQSNYSLCLFAMNESPSPDSRKVSARLYSCEIYDNNILIRDYYPCIDENGVVCLYDKVNKEYVYNSGTGEFIGG